MMSDLTSVLHRMLIEMQFSNDLKYEELWASQGTSAELDAAYNSREQKYRNIGFKGSKVP